MSILTSPLLIQTKNHLSKILPLYPNPNFELDPLPRKKLSSNAIFLRKEFCNLKIRCTFALHFYIK